MRILIDLQGAQAESRFRGIGRYSLSISEAIARNRGDHEVIIALSNLFPQTIEPIRARFSEILPPGNIKVWQIPSPVYFYSKQNDWRRVAAEKIRHAFLESLGPDTLLITSLFDGVVDNCVATIERERSSFVTAVILYDLIPLIYEDEYLADTRKKEFYRWKANSLKDADLCLSISEDSRNDGSKYLGLKADNVVNISASIDPTVFFKKRITAEYKTTLLERYGIRQPFILYSGATDPRKNLARLIGAYGKLPETLKSRYQLVLAGGMPRSHQHLLKKCMRSNRIVSDRVVFTERIDDDELVTLYRLSKCFVFPSYHEGFGLPVLEAMACGTAVIGSNVSSIPEVIGRDDALFDPFSEDDIADSITRVISDDAYRDELAEYGAERAKSFSWDKTAQRAIKALEQRAQEKSPSFSRNQKETAKDISHQIGNLIAIDHPLLHDDDLLAAAFCLSKLIPRNDKRPRLYIDISELHSKDAKTGIQRVVRSVMLPLLKYPPEGWIVRPVYATQTHGYRHAAKFSADLIGGIRRPEDDAVIDPREGDFFLGLDFQCNIVFSQYKFFNYLRNIGVRVKFIVYDMLPIKLCEYFSESVKENFERWLRIIVESDGAICISQAVSNELSDWVESIITSRQRPFEISWFHLGADIENTIPTRGLSDDCQQVLGKIKSRPSFLMVGTIEPRKGHQQAIRAFEKIWEQGIDANLVLVGKLGWKAEGIAKLLRGCTEFGSKMLWLENISDEYLEKIYQASACLIAASEGEGFGLPLIEAARHNLPIIARDIKVFREVAGEHAFYYAGTEPNKLMKTILEWMKLNDCKNIPDISGMRWLTWIQSVEQLKRCLF